MAKGKVRPSIDRAKESGSFSPISQQIKEGLEPYLGGMLKTIGQAGSGYRNKGKGDLKAALGGLKLLLDAMGGGNDSNLSKLMQAMVGKKVEFDEEEWYDGDVDEEVEEINSDIDADYVNIQN